MRICLREQRHHRKKLENAIRKYRSCLYRSNVFSCRSHPMFLWLEIEIWRNLWSCARFPPTDQTSLCIRMILTYHIQGTSFFVETNGYNRKEGNYSCCQCVLLVTYHWCTVTTFALPNLQGDEGACILKIEVTWDKSEIKVFDKLQR